MMYNWYAYKVNVESNRTFQNILLLKFLFRLNEYMGRYTTFESEL